MSLEEVAEKVIEGVAAAAAPKLAELLYKLLSGKTVSKDEALQSLGGAAVDFGLESEDLVRYVTDAGSRRIEEGDLLMRDAVYGPKP